MSKRIKIKGKCPRCGSKLVIVSIWTRFAYMNYPELVKDVPVCTNVYCDESCAHYNNIKYRWINHRTVKIDGLWE